MFNYTITLVSLKFKENMIMIVIDV